MPTDSHGSVAATVTDDLKNMRATRRSGWSSGELTPVLILGEIVVCFILIFVSTILNWPHYDYFRFAVLLPIYHAGTLYGTTGGFIGAIVSAMLYGLVIPLDLKKPDTYYGGAFAIIINALYIGFGLFIGSVIGGNKRTQRELTALSGVALELSAEMEEAALMLRLARRAKEILDVNYAAWITRAGDDSHVWNAYFIDNSGADPMLFEKLPDAHPLLWAARTGQSLATNSLSADPRFSDVAFSHIVNSALVVPVAAAGVSFGALLLASKTREDLFTQKDLDLARYLAATAADTLHNLEEERRRIEESLMEDKMKDLFSRFVSSSVAQKVLDDPEVLKGRWQEVTLLVSDIRDFTTISEQLNPSDLVSQLNEYFTMMVDIVYDHHGTIDKFIGDCIMAYWGAPEPNPDHPLHAADAALSMAAALRDLNAKWSEAQRPAFRTGIALHTCNVLIGNIGDERKRTFTVMGDEVNYAVRLESLTKKFNTPILVSGRTAERIRSRYKLDDISTPGAEDGILALRDA